MNTPQNFRNNNNKKNKQTKKSNTDLRKLKLKCKVPVLLIYQKKEKAVIKKEKVINNFPFINAVQLDKKYFKKDLLNSLQCAWLKALFLPFWF